MEANFEKQVGEQYPRIMEGIGRVALAASFLEFAVDQLGWFLTGDLQAYRALTRGISISSKADRLVQLAKHIITDEELEQRIATFLKGTKPLLEQRNRSIHSLYSEEDDGVIQFEFLKDTHVRNVDAEEFFALAEKIWGSLVPIDALTHDLRQYMNEQKLALQSMVNATPATL